MVVAVLTTHLRHDILMNWSGTQAGEGFESIDAVIAGQ